MNYIPIAIEELKAIRKLYKLDINVITLQDYELGRIRPSQTATSLFNFAKNEKELFLKYREKEYKAFVR